MSTLVRHRMFQLLRHPAVPIPHLVVVIVIIVIPLLFAPLVAPHDPLTGGLRNQFIAPFWMDGGSLEHPLGTDRVGRDILSRIVYGARTSSLVALTGVTGSMILGTAVGLIAGFKGGWVDTLLMRIVDISLALPGVLLALILAVIFGPTIWGVLTVIVFILWSFFARQVRGECLFLMREDFIALARLNGLSPARIMVFHLLPNVASSVIVLFTLMFGFVIVLESTLSFLGVGLPRPTPAWGLMIADGRTMIFEAWWVSFFPGLALTLAVASVNAWGDRLRSVLDPRRQG